MGPTCVGRRFSAYLESWFVQVTAVFLGWLGMACHWYSRDEPTGRFMAGNAMDDDFVRARGNRDFWFAAAERLRKRVGGFPWVILCHKLPLPRGVGGEFRWRAAWDQPPQWPVPV